MKDAPARERSGIPRWIHYPLFLGAYVYFGVVGVLTSLLCMLSALVWRGPSAHAFGQRLIHRLFAFFTWYARVTRILKADFSALQELRDDKGLVIVGNHPSLVDVVFVASELPRVFCVMKAALSRNLVLCGTARLAGYVENQSGLGLVKQCRERLEEGGNLLIFPEGTRTVGTEVHPFKMGFALIAKYASAPVQTIFIESPTGFLGKGRPFLRMPPLPIPYSILLGRRFDPAPDMDVKEFGRIIENYIREEMQAARLASRA